MGAEVMIERPGSALDGVPSRVTGKVTDEQGHLVYRLEHQVNGRAVMLPGQWLARLEDQEAQQVADTVIQATAAQLFEVLGKACPFVGPGLWTVKRSEVSAQAWGQLMRLVGET